VFVLVEADHGVTENTSTADITVDRRKKTDLLMLAALKLLRKKLPVIEIM